MMVHEEHFDLHMLEEDQAPEFPLGGSHTFMEEKQKHTIVELTYGGIHESTYLMDENCRALFDMPALKEIPYETPLWVAYSSLEEVVDHIPYGSTNKSLYSSSDGEDRGIIQMNNLGGKWFFYFYNVFVVTDIVLTCKQQRRFILHPLDTSCTHAYEVHTDLHMLEEFEFKQDEDQAYAWSQRDYEFPM